MLTSDFDYSLPEGLIANDPVEPRDQCSLMVLDKSSSGIEHDSFFHIEKYLKKGDVLVLNDTKVIPCRISFEWEGKKCEIFVTKFLGNNKVMALIKPGKFFKEGSKLIITGGVEACVQTVAEDGQRVICFSGNMSAEEIVEEFGEPPFPPYIKDSKAIFDQYQTVFAKDKGSLAAPTAGLHFTDRLLRQLENRGIRIVYVTLHVGLGTFLPVKEKLVKKHKMHGEEYSLDYHTAKELTKAKENGNRIIAVGTTAVRVLESSYSGNEFKSGRRSTDIFIYPGYKWKCVDGLVTNFHLPKSTLLMLVSSFAGKKFIMKAYEAAIRKKYRFYSFGDAMLIL